MRLIPGKYSLLTPQSPMDNNPEIDFHAQLAGKTGYFSASNQGLLMPCKTSPHQKYQAKAFSNAGSN